MKSADCSVIRHDFVLSVRRTAAAGLLFLAVMTVLIPASTSAVSEFSIFNTVYTHQQLKFRFAADGAVSAAGYLAFAAGAAVGMLLFSFVSDRRKSAFYFSLGVSRTCLYAIRISAGAFWLLAATGLPVLLSLILNCSALGAYEGIFSYAGAFFLSLFFQSLCGMLLFSVACLISGTVQEAAVTGLTLAAAPGTAVYFLSAVVKRFLWGNVFGAHTYGMAQVQPSLPELFSCWNPVTMAQSGLKTFNSFERTLDQTFPVPADWRPYLVWAAMLAAAMVLGTVLMNRYKAEKSGSAGLFCSSLILACTVWPAAVFAACMEYSAMLSPWMSFAVSAAAGAGMLAASGFLVQLSQRGRLFRVKNGAALAAAAVMAAGAAVSGAGGIYYRIPEVEETACVEVSYPGQLSFLNASPAVTSDGRAAYFSAELTLSSEECIRLAGELEQALQEQGKVRIEPGAQGNFQKSVLPYDLRFRYREKSGEIVERYYDRITAEGLGKLLALCETAEVKEQEAQVIEGRSSGVLWNSAAFSGGEIYLADAWMTSRIRLDLSEDYRTQLLAAAVSDILSAGVQELYHPSEDIGGVLMFTLNGETAVESFTEEQASPVIYLGEGWKNTQALLSSWGVMPATDIPEYSGVILQKFDPYACMNGFSRPMSLFFGQYRSSSDDDFLLRQDFGNRPEITDVGKIRELAEKSRGAFYMDQGGCLLAFRNASDGSLLYRFLPQELVPEDILEKLKG